MRLAFFPAIIVALISLHPAASSAEAQPKLCWKPQELRGVAGDWEVKKGTAAAFRSPPQPSSSRRAPNPLLDKDNLRGVVIRRVKLPRDAKYVALTFDLCEQPDEVAGYDSRIIDFLRERKVRATFFAGGKWMLTHEARTMQLFSDPLFEVGNHTWEHRNLRIVSPEVLHSEIENTQVAYEKVKEDFDRKACRLPATEKDEGGASEDRGIPASMTLFRFPFGACNAESLKAVNDAGLLAIQWDFASGDPAPLQTADKIVKTVMSHVRPGSIIVFHANGRGWHTHDALERIIPQLEDEGYKFLKVSELLHFPGAKIETADSCYDQKPHDSDRYDELARRLEEKYKRFSQRASSRQD